MRFNRAYPISNHVDCLSAIDSYQMRKWMRSMSNNKLWRLLIPVVVEFECRNSLKFANLAISNMINSFQACLVAFIQKNDIHPMPRWIYTLGYIGVTADITTVPPNLGTCAALHNLQSLQNGDVFSLRIQVGIWINLIIFLVEVFRDQYTLSSQCSVVRR
jgi:hypothetical protein